MKNPLIEDSKRRAKLYHRDQHGGSFKSGLTAYLSSSETDLGERALWKDQVFVVNDYRVYLEWRHPRYAYYCLVLREAHRRLFQHWPELIHYLESSGSHDDLIIIHRRDLGGNSEPIQQVAQRYLQWLNQLEHQVSRELAFEVRASMQIAWCPWCKVVRLCAPVDPKSESDWAQFLCIARELVKREVSIAELWGHYRYGQEHWLAENLLHPDASGYEVETFDGAGKAKKRESR